MSPKQTFETYGALHLKDVVSKDIASYLTHIMLRAPHYTGISDDPQVAGSIAKLDHDPACEALLERAWHLIENVIEDKLIPTYAYGRVYTNGNVLEKHTDRPACEISLTVQLLRTHHYAWPIYMGGKRFDLGECDGVLYKGCEVEHWRDVCLGPDNYMSGQVFLHYVRENGQYANEAGDKRWQELPFTRGANLVWEAK